LDGVNGVNGTKRARAAWIEHPPEAELKRLIWGGIPAGRRQEIVRHLLLGCPTCQAVVRPYASFASGQGPIPAEVDEAYDRALEKAEQWAARQAIAEVTVGGMAEGSRSPAEQPAERVMALLEASWQLRYEGSERMGQLAEQARDLAERLTAEAAGGEGRLADLRCRVWAGLANAHRVCDRLSEAKSSLDRAFSYFAEGTKNAALNILLHEVLAALAADERNFFLAEESAHTVYQIAREERDFHHAGQALLQAGTYMGWAGRPREAARYLKRGLRLIDTAREPELETLALQNLAAFLVDCREFKRAQRMVWDLERQYDFAEPDLRGLKLRGIQARIHFGEGDFARAEAEYLTLRDGLEQAGRPYLTAITALELSQVYLAAAEKALHAQGPEGERRALLEKFAHTVIAALAIFRSLQIDREALAAIILLEHSLHQESFSHDLLQQVIATLRSADRSSRVRPLPGQR
jgi:hypothetical protein